jgi:hypothetical protein
VRKPSEDTTGWIDLMANGVVIVRGTADPAPGSLPCYDAGAEATAREIVPCACVPSLEGYTVPDFKTGDLKALRSAEARFKEYHQLLREREAKKAATDA